MMPQISRAAAPRVSFFRPTELAVRPILTMPRPAAPTAQTVLNLLRPETAMEKRLLREPEIIQGMLWGEPRFGHPEGMVFLHVREVLDNIDHIKNLSKTDRERLRLIAILHDAFKFCEDRSHPRDWSKHHGKLARNFAEKHLADLVVLDIIETHDDAYYAWRASRLDAENLRILENLLRRIGHCLQLYYLFFKCDTQTGDKTQASWKWFERVVAGLEITQVKE